MRRCLIEGRLFDDSANEVAVQLHRRAPRHQLRFDIEQAENDVRATHRVQELSNVLWAHQAVTRRHNELATQEWRRQTERMGHSEALFLNHEPSSDIKRCVFVEMPVDLGVFVRHHKDDVADSVFDERHQRPFDERPPENRHHGLAATRRHRSQPRPHPRGQHDGLHQPSRCST